jgi:hypothetical protein
MEEILILLMCYCQQPVAMAVGNSESTYVGSYSEAQAIYISDSGDIIMHMLCDGSGMPDDSIKVLHLDKENAMACPIKANMTMPPTRPGHQPITQSQR